MKICGKCKIKKLSDDFYNRGNILMSNCKECSLILSKDWQKNNRNKDNVTRKLWLKTSNGKKYIKNNEKRRKTVYPERYKAKTIIKTEVESDRLKKEPCEVCGKLRVDAHHDDYSKPLSIRWLCKQHHADYHRIQRSSIGETDK